MQGGVFKTGRRLCPLTFPRVLTTFLSNLSFGASQCMSLNDLKADFLDEESSLTLELRDFTV
jgi:hypothetical protein